MPFIEKGIDLVQALHWGPGLVLDAVAQGGGVVPGGDAANTDQGQECQRHTELRVWIILTMIVTFVFCLVR